MLRGVNRVFIGYMGSPWVLGDARTSIKTNQVLYIPCCYHHQISWFYYVCAIASFFVEFFFVESFFVACELVDK